MNPWFEFAGVDSRTAGLWISSLPAIQRPLERVEKVDIYGRAGSLHLLEDNDIYEEYRKDCKVLARADADFGYLLKWLRGYGDLIFSNEPDRRYLARIDEAVVFEKWSNDLLEAEIKFTVHPFKRDVYDIQPITPASGDSIYNPGDIICRPAITMTGTGNLVLTIGDMEITVAADTENTGTYTLDCAAEFCTDGNGANASGLVTGTYPVLKPGANTVTWSGAESVSIEPVWYYL